MKRLAFGLCLLSSAAVAQAEVIAIEGATVWTEPVSYTHLTLPTNREV